MKNWASLYEAASRYRKHVSVAIGVACAFILLVSENSWPRTSVIDALMEYLGLILIGLGIFGRLWATIFICGYKNDQVVMEGPYSIVRHALYVFSFIGVMGVGLASENLLVLAILLCAFLFYYPLVACFEETLLMDRFGQRYIDYARRVPRFLPLNFRISEPGVYPVVPRLFRKQIFDVMWLLWAFIVLQLVERLHEAGVLPVWFRIP